MRLARAIVKVPAVVAAACCSALFSCVSLRQVAPGEERAIREAAVSLAAGIAETGSAERWFAEDGVYQCMMYFAGRDPAFVSEHLRGMRSAADFQSYTLHTFGLTGIECGLDMMMAWDAASHYAYGNPRKPMEEMRTRRFRISSYPGTARADDAGKVGDLAERALDRLLAAMAPEGDLRGRFESNLNRMSGRAISLILAPDSRYWDAFNATARTTFGAGWDPEKKTTYEISIGVPYYNSLSCGTLVHEITHMTDLLCKLAPIEETNPGEITGENAREKFTAWWADSNAGIFPGDTPLGEGVAMYMSRRLDVIHAAFFVSPKQNLESARGRRPIRSGILMKTPVAWDRKTRLLQYEELNSFVEFLVERRGLDEFLRFYMRPPLTEERFASFFGEDYAGAEQEWRAWLGF